jgi:hypothetical protein
VGEAMARRLCTRAHNSFLQAARYAQPRSSLDSVSETILLPDGLAVIVERLARIRSRRNVTGPKQACISGACIATVGSTP